MADPRTMAWIPASTRAVSDQKRGDIFLPALKQLYTTPSILRHSASLGKGEQDLFHHTTHSTSVPTAPNIKGPLTKHMVLQAALPLGNLQSLPGGFQQEHFFF